MAKSSTIFRELNAISMALWVCSYRNKAVYTATEVARGWARVVANRLFKQLGRSSNVKTARKRRKKNKQYGPTDGRTDGPTDIAGHRVA